MAIEITDSDIPENLLVAVSGAPGSAALVRAAGQLADLLGAAWEAIHIETPESGRDDADGIAAAECLGLASSLGATIANIPAATVLDGLSAHFASKPARHLVLGASRARPWRVRCRGSLLRAIDGWSSRPVLHLYPFVPTESPAPNLPNKSTPQAPLRFYGYAAAWVFSTLLVAVILQLFINTRPLDLLFLFPATAVAARLGLRPALLAVALSVVAYNYFLLAPALSFDPAAPQNLVMTGVLLAAAAYTSGVTARLRGRLLLSDRSAQENASLAALAQKLTRDSDWETTAHTICHHVYTLLRVQTILYHEIDGKLWLAGAMPLNPQLDPVNLAARDWVWAHGGEAGAGTEILPAADWQFQALSTSLGVLAVLGLAHDDGRNPIRADQRILLHTIVAQAALSLERLRLEDIQRELGISRTRS